MTAPTDPTAAAGAASTSQLEPIRVWRLSELDGPEHRAAQVAALEAQLLDLHLRAVRP